MIFQAIRHLMKKQARRSKYRPHQGLQERARRLIGGWPMRGWSDLGVYYTSKNQVLGEGKKRVENAARLIKEERKNAAVAREVTREIYG